MNVQEAAARSLEDSDFAQKVLTGEEDYPEVREAILADLYAELGDPDEGSDEVSGFTLNGQFIGLLGSTSALEKVAACYVRYYPKGGATDWRSIERINVYQLAYGG